MLNDNDYIKTIYESQTFGLYMPVKVQVFCCYKSLPYPCWFFTLAIFIGLLAFW